MLENCRTAKERWGGVSEIIDRWLHERQLMLVEYCGLSSDPNLSAMSEEKSEHLRKMCQIMVDYVSAGHFEVYEQLMREGKEFNDKPALQEATQLFDKVDATTDAVLDFNDKYLETDDLSSLASDLSRIGEILASRFDAEDRMIAVLHTSHKDLVA